MKDSTHHLILIFISLILITQISGAQSIYQERYFLGTGDKDYIELLDIAFRMIRPEPELENLSKLYYPEWNGFVEGPFLHLLN